jgi:DNA-binding IclR family transcriptional regulator
MPSCIRAFKKATFARMPPRTKKAQTAKSSAMTSTLRCFQVLELLAEEPFELSISDIAGVLFMPRASVHRLCTTLVEGGFVEHVSIHKRYRLTPKSLWVGSGYLRHSAIYRAAFFPMQALAKQIPGTAQLGVLSEGKVLFIHSVGYPGSMEAFADVGLRRPLHATASGKLFLASMPLDKVKELMSHRVEKFTERTTVSFAQMKEELAQVDAKGYAVNDEELLPGYLVLAAPVFNSTGRMAAAISLTLPVDHSQRENRTSHVASLLEAARKTSLQLGFNFSSGITPSKSSKRPPHH